MLSFACLDGYGRDLRIERAVPRGAGRSRDRRLVPSVAIVGYTNAGKSSLLNALSGREAARAEDQLFATLDPTSRQVKLGDGQSVVLTDTVGFIHKLPHQLVAAILSYEHGIAVRSGCFCAHPYVVHLLDLDEVVDAFLQPESAGQALGWQVPEYALEGSFSHTGFTGTSVWCDPATDLCIVLLTNRVHPTRENQKHVPLRRNVHDAAIQAIVDRPVAPRGR